MKNKLLIIVFFLCAIVSYSQTFSNITPEYKNDKIVISFQLVTNNPVNVALSYSDDDGSTFKRCKSITGSLNNLSSGNHQIIWNNVADDAEFGFFKFEINAITEGGILNKNSLNFTEKGGTENIKVIYNKHQVAFINNVHWCSVQLSGDNLIVKCDKNKNHFSRQASVLINAGSRKETLVILQDKMKSKNNALLTIKGPHGKSIWWSVGYVQRGWNLCSDMNKEIASWEQPNSIPGFQIGANMDIFFAPNKFGLGVNVGINYEFASANKTASNPDEEEYKYEFTKNVIYVPIHLLYRLDFNEKIGVYVFAGMGLDVALTESVSATYVGEYNAFFTSEIKDPKLHLSAEYGLGLRFNKVKVGLLLNNRMYSPKETFTKKQNRGFMLNIAMTLN